MFLLLLRLRVEFGALFGKLTRLLLHALFEGFFLGEVLGGGVLVEHEKDHFRSFSPAETKRFMPHAFLAVRISAFHASAAVLESP